MNDDINKKVEILTLERFGRAFTFVIVIGVVILLALEIIFHRHGENAIENVFLSGNIWLYYAYFSCHD